MSATMKEACSRKPFAAARTRSFYSMKIEKAHPDVFNVLLQVLDEGVLTDGHGKTADFKQTLIVLTSNIGSQTLSNATSQSDSRELKRKVMAEVKASFRPEFINRLDEIIQFERLSRDDMGKIVEFQLELIAKRLESRNLTLSTDHAAKEWLAREGYDPVYGARPLKRTLQKHLQNPLAELLLDGSVRDGDEISISANGLSGLNINGIISQPVEAGAVTLH